MLTLIDVVTIFDESILNNSETKDTNSIELPKKN
jgi:hypothetical protein